MQKKKLSLTLFATGGGGFFYPLLILGAPNDDGSWQVHLSDYNSDFSMPSDQEYGNNIYFFKLQFNPIWGGGTVLPNGVKVAVWDLSKMFQKMKKVVLSCSLPSYWMNLVQKWTFDNTEFLTLGQNTWLHHLRFCRKLLFY